MKKRKLWVSVMAGFLAAVMLLSLILSLIPTKAYAASSSEIKKQISSLKEDKAEIDAQIESIQSQYQANADEITDLVNRKNTIDQQIQLLNERIELTNQEITAYALLIADKQDELDEAQARLDELNQKNKERIRAMEEEGTLSYWSIIFKANDFSDLLDRLSMIEEINASDQKRLQEIREAAETVASAQEELITEKNALEQTRTEQAADQAALEEKRAEADELLAELIAKGDEFQQLLEESEALQDELMQEIAQAEQDLKDAEYQEWLATYVPTTQAPAAGTDTTPSTQAPSSSGWVRPLSTFTVTSPFGMRMHPILGYERMHNGIDLGAYRNQPIYAAKSGKVTRTAYQESGAGHYVSINHGDGFSSIYMHMEKYIVSVGDYVEAGQVIGYAGDSGLSKGVHLHFGISYNGTYVNPLKYVS